MFEEKIPFKVGCHVERLEIVFVAKCPLFFDSFSFVFFERKKNLSPTFGVIEFFWTW
jgi:hypothetical protein